MVTGGGERGGVVREGDVVKEGKRRGMWSPTCLSASPVRKGQEEGMRGRKKAVRGLGSQQ